MSGQTLEHMVEMSLVMCHRYHVVNVVHCQLGDASFHSNTLFDREIIYSLFQTIDYLFGIRQATDMPTLVTLVHRRVLAFTIEIRLIIGCINAFCTQHNLWNELLVLMEYALCETKIVQNIVTE